MKLEGLDRAKFMDARGKMSASRGYYKSADEAFAKDRAHLPLLTLGWCDKDFVAYQAGYEHVAAMLQKIDVIRYEANLTMKEMLTKAERSSTTEA